MKKQFIIKSAQAIKNTVALATKLESGKSFNLTADDSPCCDGFMVRFVAPANSKPVFSL